MNPLVALHLALLTLTDRTRCGLATRRQQLREQDREVGLSTLEIVVIALGLFLLAGVLVAAITAAVNSRISQIG